jgi:hypothetical protein
MAKLRKKVWDIFEMTSTVENQENEIDKQIPTSEHELINVNRELVKVETNVVPVRKKRANETSVSFRTSNDFAGYSVYLLSEWTSSS